MMVASHLLAVSVLFAASMAGQALVNGPFVIIVGPPESGKTTQAKLVAQRLNVPLISAEDIIASNPNAFQKNRHPDITGMQPRTDPALNKLFGDMIASGAYRNGVVVDGYPATKDHFDYLRSMIADGRLPKPAILQLDISDEALRKRLGPKADAQFEQLLKDYHREMDMLAVYFPRVKVIGVNADGTPAEVAKRVEHAIAAIRPAKKTS